MKDTRTEVEVDWTDPFAELIHSFVAQEFPVVVKSEGERLDIVSRILLGTKDTRFGPLPSPEAHVAIRKIISNYMEKNVPIQLLTPWGGVKANFPAPLDIAELAALKRMACLSESIRLYYEPGIRIHIRVEDTGARILWGEDIGVYVDSYSNSFRNLSRALGYSDFIHPVPESMMGMDKQFKATVESMKPLFFEYLRQSDMLGMSQFADIPTLQKLTAMGWKGNIPAAMRKYYYDRYHNLGIHSLLDKQASLATYLASAFARKRLNLDGYGADVEFIKLNFQPPVPGASETLASIYYRTIPSRMTRNHIAPWRGRGFLMLSPDGVNFKIANWDEARGLELNPFQLHFKNEEAEAFVNADYLVTD